jgi:poly(hydroxyalkanoate) depolymerase family esterase
METMLPCSITLSDERGGELDMQGLGATLAAIKRAQAEHAPVGARRMKETISCGPNPGELRMLSFIPQGLKSNAPLVVVLHGCTQSGESHAQAAGWLALAERCGFAVLAPEQRPTNNANRCFNWFEPNDTTRDRGEAASIRAMVAEMIDAHGLDPSRVFITGLSAGGAMTSIMLALYPDVFAAGAVVAGLPYGAADSVESAFRAMRGRTYGDDELTNSFKRANPGGVRPPRVSIWHGDADHTVNAINAADNARQWVSAHALNFAAGETETLGRRQRTVWRAPHTGEVMVESNIVRGLGHGTPLSTTGPAGVGSVAPFMLEVEISAATEIARFWRLGDIEVVAPTAPGNVAPALPKSSLGETVLASISRRVPSDVEAVIVKALKSAGLMR